MPRGWPYGPGVPCDSKREAGGNPARSRHCNRGATRHEPLSGFAAREGVGERGSGSQETCLGAGSGQRTQEWSSFAREEALMATHRRMLLRLVLFPVVAMLTAVA